MLLPVTCSAACCTARADLPMLSAPVRDILSLSVRSTGARSTDVHCTGVLPVACDVLSGQAPGGRELRDGFHHADAARNLRDAVLRVDARALDRAGEKADDGVEVAENRAGHPAGHFRAGRDCGGDGLQLVPEPQEGLAALRVQRRELRD